MTSTNPIVRNALAAQSNTVSTNASATKVSVTIKTVTDKGLQTFQKSMSLYALETWMQSAGLGEEIQSVYRQLATEGVDRVRLSRPAHITIAS